MYFISNTILLVCMFNKYIPFLLNTKLNNTKTMVILLK